MPRYLRNEAAYQNYIAALNTALMHGACTKPSLGKSQAVRFRHMCYQIRQIYRDKNNGVSPWESIVITIDKATSSVLLMNDKHSSLMYDAEGNVVDVEAAAAATPVDEVNGVQTWLRKDWEEHCDYEFKKTGRMPKLPANVRLIDEDEPITEAPEGMDIVDSLGL